MSALSALQENRESIQRLFEHFGGYSLEMHLVIAVCAALVLVGGPVLIGIARGSNRNITRGAQRDVLIGIACLLPIFTFLGFFFFVGRGYLMAFCADPE